jgi:hypothetical protein
VHGEIGLGYPMKHKVKIAKKENSSTVALSTGLIHKWRGEDHWRKSWVKSYFVRVRHALGNLCANRCIYSSNKPPTSPWLLQQQSIHTRIIGNDTDYDGIRFCHPFALPNMLMAIYQYENSNNAAAEEISFAIPGVVVLVKFRSTELIERIVQRHYG